MVLFYPLDIWMWWEFGWSDGRTVGRLVDIAEWWVRLLSHSSMCAVCVQSTDLRCNACENINVSSDFPAARRWCQSKCASDIAKIELTQNQNEWRTEMRSDASINSIFIHEIFTRASFVIVQLRSIRCLLLTLSEQILFVLAIITHKMHYMVHADAVVSSV